MQDPLETKDPKSYRRRGPLGAPRAPWLPGRGVQEASPLLWDPHCCPCLQPQLPPSAAQLKWFLPPFSLPSPASLPVTGRDVWPCDCIWIIPAFSWSGAHSKERKPLPLRQGTQAARGFRFRLCPRQSSSRRPWRVGELLGPLRSWLRSWGLPHQHSTPSILPP